jgi:serine protease AprX
MTLKPEVSEKSIHPKILGIALIVVGLFVSLFVGSAAMPGALLRAQPALLELAAQQPDTTVGVIVQKTARAAGVEELVAKLGGKVTKDLHIINAFAAELRPKSLPQLARSDGVRWVSLDAPVKQSAAPIDTSNLKSAFVKAVRADAVWNEAPGYLQGQGITVAIVDSGGCTTCDDLQTNGRSRYLAQVTFFKKDLKDFYGHGLLVAGVVGANGSGSGGQYLGIAPAVNFVSVKVSDNLGEATASSVVAGLQWVNDNASTYNIRVVTLSLNESVQQSYNSDPLDAAVEILWFNKVVVVVPAGNNGTSNIYAPANDPFVITVGAADDRGTPNIADDTIAPFTAYGVTEVGTVKPDLVAPGTNIVSIVPRYKNKLWKDHADHRLSMPDKSEYFMTVSGTSMAVPIVGGAVALLLQDEPNLNPDQVRYRLMATASKGWPGYDPAKAGAGYLDIYAAVHGTTYATANTGTAVSQLLGTGSNPPAWGSVTWNSVTWNSVTWNSVNWNSVTWNSVTWNSDYWGQ